jgi:hypothetical protein
MLAVVYESCGMVASKAARYAQAVSASFPRDIVNRMLSGGSELFLVQNTSMPDQTLRRWKE